MKHFKRSNMYKASNVTFDPVKIEAYSYSHWCFVKVIDGLVVFNDYRYSVSTSKHQYRVRSLMAQLGIKIDLFVDTRASLNDSDALDSAVKRLGDKAESAFDTMFAPRKRANTRVKAFEAWVSYNEEIIKLQTTFKERLLA